MNCVLIENDSAAIQIIENHIINIPFLRLTKCFADPIEAISFIYANSVELILLDINLHNSSQIDIISLCQNKIPVIFLADCSKYAIEGFEMNAIDFLVKPVSFERFLKSVVKAMELRLLKDIITKNFDSKLSEDTDKPLFIKSGAKIHKINPTDILFLEKEGNYFNIHLIENRKLLIRMNFFEVFRHITNGNFKRIHKSYIVNVQHINAIEGQNVIIQNYKLPIGASYKQEVINYLKIL